MDNEASQTGSSIFSSPAPADAGETAPPEAPVNELEMLKAKARLIGVEFSNNIGAETLRARIATKMAENDALEDADGDGIEDTVGIDPSMTTAAEIKQEDPSPLTGSQQSAQADLNQEGKTYTAEEVAALIAQAKAEAATASPVVAQPAVASPKMSLRQQLLAEQTRLVRIRITCMDPKKADLPGEVFTVANEYIGTHKKYVPYGEASEDGWHVPYCIYKMLCEKEFLSIRTIKDKRTGTTRPETKWVKEFAIEVLPDLTPAELKQLAAAQAAEGLVD